MKVSRTIVAIGLMAMTVMLTSYTVVQTVQALHTAPRVKWLTNLNKESKNNGYSLPNTIHSPIHPFTPSKNKTKNVFMAIYVDLSFSYFVAFTALSTLFIVFAFNTWATTV